MKSLVGEVVFLCILVAVLLLLARWFVAHRGRLIGRLAHAWRRVIRSAPMQAMRRRYPRLWTFFAARFARGEYLGLHLTIGLAISIASMWVFLSITEAVVQREAITRIDVAVLEWMRAHSTPAGTAFARAVSAMGAPRVIAALGLVGLVVLVIRQQWLLVEGWVVALIGGEALNAFLKRLIQRPRPLHSTILSSQSWSFPSGHAMESLVAYGMLAYVLFVLFSWPRRRRIDIAFGATLLILLIGWSRVYLGVHYVSDVIGGFAAGVIWLATCISGMEVARRWSGLLEEP